MRLLCPLLLVLFSGVAHADPPILSVGQAKILESGKAIVKEMKPTGGDGVAARAMAIVDAPPKPVFDVVNACEHFAKFMPRTKASKMLLKFNENEKVCHTEISMPFPFSNLVSDVKSTSRTLPGGGFERKWVMLKGNYKRNTGQWQIWPYNKGTQSLVVYIIDVDPDMNLPDAIIRKAQTGSLPKVFKAIEKRVKSL